MTIILIQLVTLAKIRRQNFTQSIPRTIDYLTNLDLTRIVLNSISIVTIPPLFFFYSLYYTDSGSLLFTLLVYYFSLSERHLLASIFGLIAVTFRQTNIVWVFYAACLTILQTFEEFSLVESSSTGTGGISDECELLDKNDSHSRRKSRGKLPGPRNSEKLISFNQGLMLALIKRCLPYATVGLLFLLFILLNKGIVLGDKEAHQPKLHLAQILYFLGFCSLFGTAWMFQLRILKRFLYFTIRSPLTVVLAGSVIIFLIASGRYAHPYLLADNRHITFYIWRRILDRHNSYVPYMLTPVYLIASFSVWHHFRSQGCKRLLLFIFCSLMVIVPNGLFELRYFIIPYALLRLNADVGASSASLEILQNILTNIGMHYLFLHKTFRWTDSQELQRIMW